MTVQGCVHAPGASVAQLAAKVKVNYAEMEANVVESDDEDLVTAEAAAEDGLPLHSLRRSTRLPFMLVM